VVLSKSEVASLTRSLRQNEDALRPVPDALTEVFGRLVRLAKEPDAPHRGSRVVVAVNALLLELFDLFEARPVRYSPALTDASRSVRLFLEELRARLAEPWSVRGMADACGLGVTYFTRHFLLVTGESPARHLLRLRLACAAKRLRDEPGLTVAEIARQLGFQHASYFSRVFVERYGCTAAVWRSRSHL
jgi:AraC family L-rhamnose operon regulatory protein RhaS